MPHLAQGGGGRGGQTTFRRCELPHCPPRITLHACVYSGTSIVDTYVLGQKMCPHDKRGVLIPEVGLYTQVHLRNCPDYRGVLIYTFQRCPLKEVSPYCSLTYILHTMYIHTYIHVHTHASRPSFAPGSKVGR